VGSEGLFDNCRPVHLNTDIQSDTPVGRNLRPRYQGHRVRIGLVENRGGRTWHYHPGVGFWLWFGLNPSPVSLR
jgi:hypothetical protein